MGTARRPRAPAAVLDGRVGVAGVLGCVAGQCGQRLVLAGDLDPARHVRPRSARRQRSMAMAVWVPSRSREAKGTKNWFWRVFSTIRQPNQPADLDRRHVPGRGQLVGQPLEQRTCRRLAFDERQQIPQHAQLLGAALHVFGYLADAAAEPPAHRGLADQQRAQPAGRLARPDPPPDVRRGQRGKHRQQIAGPGAPRAAAARAPTAAARRYRRERARPARRRRALP